MVSMLQEYSKMARNQTEKNWENGHDGFKSWHNGQLIIPQALTTRKWNVYQTPGTILRNE